MVRTGEVVGKEDGVVQVVFERLAACATCNGCMNHQCTRIEFRADADVGDTIDVELAEKTVLKASAIFYIVPLVLLLAGMYVGSLLYAPLGIGFDKELFAALCGIVLMALGFLGVWGIDKTLRNRREWEPRVIRVHKKEG